MSCGPSRRWPTTTCCLPCAGICSQRSAVTTKARGVPARGRAGHEWRERDLLLRRGVNPELISRSAAASRLIPEPRTRGTMLYTNLDSLIGELLLLGDEQALHGLYMQEGAPRSPCGRSAAGGRAIRRSAHAARRVLGRHEAELRRTADHAWQLVPAAAWRALQEIPYGETISYGEQARRIGPAADPRAVGQANGRNPIAVIVPCHRVIAPTEA